MFKEMWLLGILFIFSLLSKSFVLYILMCCYLTFHGHCSEFDNYYQWVILLCF